MKLTAELKMLCFLELPLLLVFVACNPVPVTHGTPAAFQQDFSAKVPSSQSEQEIPPDQAAQDKVKLSMYGKGCKQPGSEETVLQLDPKLAPNDTFIFEESKVVNNNHFNIKYSLSLNAVPTNNGPLVFSGLIDNISASNFKTAILSHGNLNVTQKCVVLDPKSTEKCYPVEAEFTDEFSNYYQHTLSLNESSLDSSACQLQLVTEPSAQPINQSLLTTGLYTLSNGTTVNVYIRRTQENYTRTCGRNGQQTVIVTRVVATSNDVVSSRYSHCGGEIMYSKEIIRDTRGVTLSANEFKTDLAPIKP